MGGSQSVPSRPASPTTGITPISRPSTSRRVSSFRPSTRRKPSHLNAPPGPKPIGASDPSDRSAVQVSAPPIDVKREIHEERGQRLDKSGVPQNGTPCRPTAPGPPVAHTSDTATESSYSLPSSIDSSSPTPIIPYSQPDITTTSNITPDTSNTTSSTPPFRPSHSRNLSLPNPASPTGRAMSGTLTALLGFSGPAELNPSPPSSDLPTSLATESVAGQVEANLNGSDDGVQDDDATDEDEYYERMLREVEDEQESIRVERDAISAEAEALDSERDLLSAERSELAELQTRLDTAREELARSRVELDQLRARNRVPVGAMLVIQGLAQTRITSGALGETPQESVVPGADAEGGAGSIASGSATSASGAVGQSIPSFSSTPPRRPNIGRRISDGSLFRRRGEIERERGASLEQQARMISGLLTVAAAATANTLLAVPEETTPSPAPRTGLTGALQSLLNRLRPTRTPQHGIEQALGQYLQNVVRDARRPPALGVSAAPGGTATGPRVSVPPLSIPASQGGAEAGSEFQAFLQGLEGDLVGAVRAYAGSVRSEDWAAELENVDTIQTVQEGSGVGSEPSAAEEMEAEMGSEDTSDQSTGDSDVEGDDNEDEGEEEEGGEDIAQPAISTSSSTETPSETPAIPAFHAQLGQNVRSSGSGPASDRYGVSGGRNGQPRSLNFFRAHLFPPIPFGPTAGEVTGTSAAGPSSAGPSSGAGSDSSSAATLANDPNAIVPCIFVGVRSVQRDPNSTSENPEDMFNTPGSFDDGNNGTPSTAPPPQSESTAPVSADSTRPSLAHVTSPPLSPSTAAPRSFRERFLSRLSRRPPLTPAHPVNTYLVYVIGGNYPANHPILRIPALLTGAPLTDEDMALISELMGPAKAPTASKEDIERAGLKMVDGSQMAELGRNGEVLDNCTERCLICLGDYEQGEECRVLTCRHGYHKACVDQWLEKGSNSCPACRSEAVDTNKTAPTSTAAAGLANSSAETLPSLSPPIPVLSVAAGLQGPDLTQDVD